jgi:hypothetical protein
MTQITKKQFDDVRSLTSQLRTKVDALGDRAPDDPDVKEVEGLLATLESLTSEDRWVPVAQKVPQTEPETPKTPHDELHDRIALMRIAHVSRGLDQFAVCDVLDELLNLIESQPTGGQQ